MVPHSALWLPTILSAVFVFVGSFLIHMVLKYHMGDMRKLSNEDDVRTAVRGGNPAPGLYMFPHHGSDMEAMKSPEFQQKMKEGPVGLLTVLRPGPMAMGPSLLKWFIFGLFVSFVAGYIACHALPAGASYTQVFRIVGTVAWFGYASAYIPISIWWGRPWSVTLKDLFDGAVYGCITAATFAWLWPR